MKTSIPKLHSIRWRGTDNVVPLSTVTKHNLDANNVLMGAINAGLSEVVICGYLKTGDEFFSSSLADGGDALWHLERMKKMLLEVPDRDSAERFI